MPGLWLRHRSGVLVVAHKIVMRHLRNFKVVHNRNSAVLNAGRAFAQRQARQHSLVQAVRRYHGLGQPQTVSGPGASGKSR